MISIDTQIAKLNGQSNSSVLQNVLGFLVLYEQFKYTWHQSCVKQIQFYFLELLALFFSKLCQFLCGGNGFTMPICLVKNLVGSIICCCSGTLFVEQYNINRHNKNVEFKNQHNLTLKTWGVGGITTYLTVDSRSGYHLPYTCYHINTYQ